MGRLPWLPPLLALVLLVAVAVDANLGHPVPFELHESGWRSNALVALVSASLYYAVLLLALRLHRSLRPPGKRAAAAAGATVAFALGLAAAGELPGVSLVPARGRHALAEAPRDAPRAPADARADGEAVVDLATSGTLLHVGRDGKILLVDRGPPGGLRLVDGRGAPVGAFRPPPSLRLAD